MIRAALECSVPDVSFDKVYLGWVAMRFFGQGLWGSCNFPCTSRDISSLPS